MLGKATGNAKEHSVNKIPIVMIVGKCKIMRSGPKTVTVTTVSPSELFVWVEVGGECGVGCV